MKLTLQDWNDADERRFQRRKLILLKRALQERNYDTNPYHNPNPLCNRAYSGHQTTQELNGNN
jgi:hypothetical protein